MEKIKKIRLSWISKQQRKQILRKKLEFQVGNNREFRAAIKFRSRKNKIFKFKKRGNNGLGVALIRRILESEIFDLIHNVVDGLVLLKILSY